MYNNYALASSQVDGAFNFNIQMTREMVKGIGISLKYYAFMQEGLINHWAQSILDEDIFIPFSKEFGGKVINMDKKFFKGVYARDLLDSAVRGKLGRVCFQLWLCE